MTVLLAHKLVLSLWSRAVLLKLDEGFKSFFLAGWLVGVLYTVLPVKEVFLAFALALVSIWHNPVFIQGKDIRLYCIFGLVAIYLTVFLLAFDVTVLLLSFSVVLTLVYRFFCFYKVLWGSSRLIGFPLFSLFLMLIFVGFINGGDVSINTLLITMLQLQFSFFVLDRFFLLRMPIWVLIWFFSLASSLLVSNYLASINPDLIAASFRVWSVLGHAVFVFCVALYVDKCRLKVAWIVFPVLLCMFFLLLFYVFFWHTREFPYYHDWINNLPFYRNIRHQGYFNAAACCVSFIFIMHAGARLRMFAFFSLVLVFSLLLWNGGRGSFLSVFLALPILVISYGFRSCLGRWGVIGLAFVMGLLISYIYRVDQSSIGWYSALLRSENSSGMNTLASGRLVIWEQLLSYVGIRPVMGWGGEGVRSLWPDNTIRQAHNGLVQLLIEWGLVGTLLIIMPIIIIYFMGLRRLIKIKGDALLTLGLLLTTSMLAYSVVDGIFYYAMPGMFLALGLGIIAGSQKDAGLARNGKYSQPMN